MHESMAWYFLWVVLWVLFWTSHQKGFYVSKFFWFYIWKRFWVRKNQEEWQPIGGLMGRNVRKWAINYSPNAPCHASHVTLNIVVCRMRDEPKEFKECLCDSEVRANHLTFKGEGDGRFLSDKHGSTRKIFFESKSSARILGDYPLHDLFELFHSNKDWDNST